jgi:hypothetical protein
MIEQQIAEELIKYNFKHEIKMRCVWLERPFFSSPSVRVCIDTYDVQIVKKTIFVNGIAKRKLNIYSLQTQKILIQGYGDIYTGFFPR